MQSAALILLNHLDELEKAKDRSVAFRRALLSRVETDIQKLFPEYFPEPEPKEEPTETGGVVPDDYKDVEWMSPKDANAEWERMSKLLAAGGRGVLNGEEVVGTAQERPLDDIEWTEWR